MNIYMNFLFSGFILSLILAVFFFIRRKFNSGNIFFSLFLLSYSLILLLSMASVSGININTNHVLFLSNITSVLIILSGSSLFGYINIQLYSENPGTVTTGFYFLPGAAVLLYALTLYSLDTVVPGFDCIRYYSVSYLIFISSYIYMILMIVKAYICWRSWKRELKEVFSNTERKKNGWFGVILYGSFILSSIDIVSRVIEFFHGSFQHNYQIIDFIEIVFILVISYFILLQPQIFLNPVRSGQKKQEKYGRTKLSQIELYTSKKELDFFMTQEKAYLRDLSLSKLADEMGWSIHRLSQVINSDNENFYSYINRFRVEEVIRLLQEDKEQSLTLLDIALKAGFQSKSVFNLFFKKVTGVTPSQYRQKAIREQRIEK